MLYFRPSGILIAVVMLFLILSCRKEDEIDTSPSLTLSFSTDTVMFDTVFTTIGSTTRILKVYNDHSNKVNISSIALAGNEGSPYRMNVDGQPVTRITGVEIDGGDSLFIFVRVTVDPANQNSPLIVSDSIIFNTNGNMQDVDLVAWGQDAYYHIGDQYLEGFRFPYTIIVKENEEITWINDKPHVIYGYAVVDSTGVLNVTEGARIHFHKNSGMWIYKGGTINSTGTFDMPVIFQGDRLEESYDNLPGQWDRIWINEGGANYFKNTIIKNSFIGIQAEILDPQSNQTAHLVLENCEIRNTTQWGLFTISYQVTAGNTVFANSGENVVFLSTGGSHDFRHCTFANYWNHSIRQSPLFVLSNYIVVQDAAGNQITYLGDLVQAFFGNCIIYGNLDEEFQLAEDESVEFNFTFDHSLIKTQSEVFSPAFIECIISEDPLFRDSYDHNFMLDTLSPAIDRGSMQVINEAPLDLMYDLGNNPRTNDEGPDLGAYEYRPEIY